MGVKQTNEKIGTGDVEAILNKAKLRGRPMMSTMIREKDGTQVFFKRNKQGRVEIVERYNPDK
jgi:hypothetical protein